MDKQLDLDTGDQVTSRRIAVTGARGYVGTPTVRHLRAMGHEIHALGRLDPALPDVHFHSVDLLAASDEQLRAVLQSIEADTLLHLAWSVEPGKFWTDLGNLAWVGASLKLFRAFTECGGARLVGVGSCAEYDWSRAPLVETSPIEPHTLYGTAKASLGKMAEALGTQEDIEICWGRIFFMYGPGEPRGKLVADSVAALLKGQRVETSEGWQLRDFMFIEDVGRALAMTAASHVTGPVNIASGTAIPVRALLTEIESVTAAHGLIDFGARKLTPGEPADLSCRVDRLRDEVGFAPHFSLSVGVKKTVEWWRRETGGY